MDLDGKVVFKVKLGDEIKKIVIHNEDINFNELLLMMQRIFSEKIKPNDEFSMKYTDEENDLVTLANDSDVSLALQTSKILKLTLFLKETEEVQDAIKPNEIVKELQNIRSSIDRFLEKFATSLKLDTKHSPINDLSIVSNATEPPTNGHHPVSSINVESHKEFDPLTKTALDINHHSNDHHQQLQRQDSVNSLELSASQKNFEGLKQPESPHFHQQQQQQQAQQQQQPQTFGLNNQQMPPQQPMLHQPQAQLPHQQQQQLPYSQHVPTASVAPPPSQPSQLKQPYAVQHQQFPHQTPPPQAQNKPGFLQQQPQQHQPQQQQQQQQQQQHYNPQQQAPAPQQQGQMPANMMNQPPSAPIYYQQPPGMGMNSGGKNPYAKPPGSNVMRPPSSTQFYHQGYN